MYEDVHSFLRFLYIVHLDYTLRESTVWWREYKRDYANLLEVLNKFRVKSTENWFKAYAENYSNRIIGYTVVYL